MYKLIKHVSTYVRQCPGNLKFFIILSRVSSGFGLEKLSWEGEGNIKYDVEGKFDQPGSFVFQPKLDLENKKYSVRFEVK